MRGHKSDLRGQCPLLPPRGTRPGFICTYGLVDLKWPLCVRDRGVHETLGCPICHFRFQKCARERPLCGRYAPSMRTFAEPALNQAPQQTLRNGSYSEMPLNACETQYIICIIKFRYDKTDSRQGRPMLL